MFTKECFFIPCIKSKTHYCLTILDKIANEYQIEQLLSHFFAYLNIRLLMFDFASLKSGNHFLNFGIFSRDCLL